MKTHSIKLIDGIFDKSKARDLLGDMLAFKINYHKLIRFSNQEMFGRDIEHSTIRIEQLSIEKEQLINLFDSLRDTDQVSINCIVEVKITGKES